MQAKEIRKTKFRTHNSQWCEIVGAEDKSQNYQQEENAGFEDDDISSHYERSESVLQSGIWNNV